MVSWNYYAHRSSHRNHAWCNLCVRGRRKQGGVRACGAANMHSSSNYVERTVRTDPSNACEQGKKEGTKELHLDEGRKGCI